jgi:hypothetical protein
MKIGILTFHRAHNYGALLQAYALQTFLKNLGHEVNLIDYWPEYHRSDYKLIPNFKSRSFSGKIKAVLYFLIGFFKILKRSRGYEQFIVKQFNLSCNPRFKTDIEIKYLEYDAVVYGSDQIWRYSNYDTFEGFSDVYFGAYPKNVKKKVAYAASMGVINSSKIEESYLKSVLHNFNSISVRENNLKSVIEKILGHPVPLVLDPVFLLNRNQWLNLNAASNILPKEKYIFFYHLTFSKDAINFTNSLKAYYGFRIIEIRGRVAPLLFGNRYAQTASPSDFISLIQNAEIVVSTSFHGVAFSLLFEKQFYALGMNNNSNRVQTLLGELGVSRRYLKKSESFDLNEKIDYGIINKSISLLKDKSQKYLIDSLRP